MQAYMTTPEGKTFGTSHGRAKLTYEDVDKLRKLRHKHGLTYRALGQMFGIDHKTARNAAIGKTWHHTTGCVVYRVTNEDVKQVSQMLLDGIGIHKIAAQLGATEDSILQLMESNGLSSTNPPPGRKSHCKHGHPFTGSNLKVTASGMYVCRECCNTSAREYQRKRRAKLKEAK